MNVALSFNIENGHITARKGLVRDFDGYYERISHADEKRLLILLEDFYQKSDSDWYDSFFSPRKNSSFKIHLCIITGPANYAARQRYEDGTEKVCAVMGCCDRNNEGRILYGVHYTLPVIIHECNHSYCNPLSEEVWDKIKDKSTEIFIAYGNPLFVMNETYVEACVIRTKNGRFSAYRPVSFPRHERTAA